jgi:predicted porin
MKKLLVVLLVLGLAAPAMAQSQFHFYGSLRTHIGYYDASENYTVAPGPAMDGTIAAGAGFSDEGILLSMSAQSRLGVRGAVSDKLFGVVEFGLTETTRAGKSQSPYTRLAFGQWNFGAGNLIIGKHYTPATFLFYSNMIGDIADSGDGWLLVAGMPYIGRQPQIRLTIAGFEFALIEQNNPTAAQPLTLGTMTDIDRTIPRLEAAYVFRTPVIAVRPVLGYQTYKIENNATGDDKTIDSYVAGLGVSLTLGPAYIKMTGSWLQNASNYGNPNLAAPVARAATLVDDAETLQGTFVAGFNFSPTFFVEAGVGYTENKVDVAPGVEMKQIGAVYYLQAPITVAKGFTLIPEVGQLDRGDIEITGAPDAAQGRLTYFVANLKIDF